MTKAVIKKIKSICIVYRPLSPEVFQTVQEVVGWLRKKKLTVFIHPELPPIPGTRKISTSAHRNSIDLVLALGGDGTFLRAVNLLEARPIPILGINMGSLGFLTEIKAEELYDAMELSLQNRMVRIERSMLQATVICRSGKQKSYNVLNEVVLERRPNTNIVDLSIYIGHLFVSTLKADGLIVASPTGSTAYSLSAGGPILSPNVEALVMTPVCPHTLTNRPIVFPANQEVKLKLNTGADQAYLMVDGQRVDNLKPSDVLLVTKGKNPMVMLAPIKRNYFDVLRTKLRFGERD